MIDNNHNDNNNDGTKQNMIDNNHDDNPWLLDG